MAKRSQPPSFAQQHQNRQQHRRVVFLVAALLLLARLLSSTTPTSYGTVAAAFGGGHHSGRSHIALLSHHTTTFTSNSRHSGDGDSEWRHTRQRIKWHHQHRKQHHVADHGDINGVMTLHANKYSYDDDEQESGVYGADDNYDGYAASSPSINDDPRQQQEQQQLPSSLLWQKRSKHWVVIVDGDAAVRQSIGQLLFDHGYQVTACRDGNTALNVVTSARSSTAAASSKQPAQAQHPSVMLICDLVSSGMDGMDLLRTIRESSPANDDVIGASSSSHLLKSLPVIMFTTKAQTHDRIAYYAVGADAVLAKQSFDQDELVAVLDSVIERYEVINGQQVGVIDELQRDLDEIKSLLLEKGGAGVGNGWVSASASSSPSSTRITSSTTAMTTRSTDDDDDDSVTPGAVFLAPDERQVLELLSQGLTTKQIAARCYLSTRRVEQLLTAMFRKTHTRNRTQLVRWAFASGQVQV